MNDRISAAPPVSFLGPDERTSLEQPVPLAELRTSEDDQTAGAREKEKERQTFSRRSGTRLLAQAWEGVRGRLRLRKEQQQSQRQPQTQQQQPQTLQIEDERIFSAWTAGFSNLPRSSLERPQTSHGDTPSARTRSQRAAKKASQPNLTAAATVAASNASGYASPDEVLASYKQLVSQGFFKANAIHSTRVPAPGPPPRVPPPPAPTPQQREDLPRRKPRPSTASSVNTDTPPMWPLSLAPVTPTVVRVPSAVRSPASASSRGTKRAAADSDDDDDDASDHAGSDKENDDDNEMMDQMGSPNYILAKDIGPKRKLRKIMSNDFMFMPKTRDSASLTGSMGRRGGRRSVSASSSTLSQRNRLTKRAPTPHRLAAATAETGRSRSKKSSSDDGKPLSVVPDANRGIPALPPKFTYGEDRENNGPWRGLRIR